MDTTSARALRVALVAVLSATLCVQAQAQHHGHGGARAAPQFAANGNATGQSRQAPQYYGTPQYGAGSQHSGAAYYNGGSHLYQGGRWYQRVGPGYAPARAPIGVVVPYLPIGYSTVRYSGTPYYYANDAFYLPAPGGYVIAPAPFAGLASDQVPGYGYRGGYPETYPGSSPQAQAQALPGNATQATWYYCDSAEAYYPYVNVCNEGWRSVPAVPPAPPQRQ